VATKINSFKILDKSVFILSISAIFQSLLALLQFYKQSSVGGVFYFFGERMFFASTPGIANASINGELLLRPYATFSHPNVLAGFLLSVMLLSLWVYGKAKDSLRKNIYAACVLLGSIALLLTLSRVAIVLWIVIMGALLFRTMRKRYMALISIVCLAVVFVFTPVGSRIIETRLNEEAVVQRQELMGSSMTLFKEHPILGVGLGNFIHAFSQVQSPTNLMYLQPVHNIFLLVLVELGIIGLTMFLWFLAKTYVYMLKRRVTHTVFILLFTSLLLLGLFDHYLLTLQQGSLLFAVVVGFSWTNLDKRD
jgi:O-antigen ligase